VILVAWLGQKYQWSGSKVSSLTRQEMDTGPVSRRSRARARRTSGWYRRLNPISTAPGFARIAATSRCTSSSVTTGGFSTKTRCPASTAAQASRVCESCAVATTTRPGAGVSAMARSASVVASVNPYSRPTSAAICGSRFATAYGFSRARRSAGMISVRV
jgi:hypothetical protein